ncbi:MAG: hypothetical protein WC718_08600, partial [Phycisphaerales bacterium]
MSGRLVVLAAALLLAGCEGGPPEAITPNEVTQPSVPPQAAVREIGANSQPGETLTSVDRLDVFAGKVLVLPLDVAPTGPVVVTLDDGRVLNSSLHSIQVTVPADPSLAGGDVWLPSPGVWQSRVGKGAESDPWVLRVEMPADGAGHDVVINGWRVRANWLPTGLPRGDGKAEDPWRAARPPKAPAEIASSPRVYPESQSPISRWRWRLVADGLAPDASAAPFADPVIEALARQNEDRWRVALAWVWGANADTAHRLKQRIAAVVDFGNGVYAPAWPTDHGQLDHLLAGLLDPAISPSRRVLVAEQWLKGCTSAVAWVMDDGGTLDQSRRVLLPTIGVASLLDHSTLGWSVLGVPGAEARPGPDALRPFGAMTAVSSVVAPATKEDVEAVAGAEVGEAHLGAWSVTLPVLSKFRPVVPPGVAIGPMWADQTMEAWLQGKAAPARGGMTTVGLLQRAPSVAGADGMDGAWEVFEECRGMQGTPLGERRYPGGERGYPGADERDEVRLYFGAFGRGSVVRVTAKGSVAGGDVDRVPIGRRGDVWSFRLRLPPGAVEA